MKLINRYVLREHLGPFVFALTALTSLLILQFIAKQFADLVGKGLGWDVIAQFFLLSIPFTLAVTLPMSILVAVLYAFSRLASENEITAMRAGGISTRTLMVPVLVAATVLGVGMLWFNDQVLPKANHQLQTLRNDILRTKPTFALREQVINPVQEQRLYLRAVHIDPQTSQLQDVTIFDLTDPTRRRTIIAQRGHLALSPNQRDLDVTLYNGVIISIPLANPDQIDRVYYATNKMVVHDVLNQFETTDAAATAKGPREMSVCEMQVEFVSASAQSMRAQNDYQEAVWMNGGRRGPEPRPNVLRGATGIGYYYCKFVAFAKQRLQRGAHVPPKAASPVVTQRHGTGPPEVEQASAEMIAAQAQYKALKTRENTFAVEIEKKFALSAACIVLAFLGGPIALRFPRSGIGLVIGASFSIFALYYVCLIGGETLAENLTITPFWAMWAANIIFGSVGLVLFSRMGHETATSRGGSAGEAIAAVKRWIRARTKRGPSAA